VEHDFFVPFIMSHIVNPTVP